MLKMSNGGPVTRQKEQKDGDSGLSNSVLQELKALNNKIDGMKEAFESQLNSKVDSLHVLLEKLAIEN